MCESVWELYAQSLHHLGLTSSMIERDDNIPALAALVNELDHARIIANTVFSDSSITPQIQTSTNMGSHV